MRKGINGAACFFMGMMVFLTSCGNLSPEEYLTTIDSSQTLCKVIHAGSVDYTIRVQTPEAIALKGSYNSKTGAIDKAAYLTRLKELQGFIFFTIAQQVPGSSKSVLKYNVSGHAEYEQRLMYYQFYAMNDLTLSSDGKVSKPSSYNYENHMEISPVNTIVVAFSDDGTARDFQLTFDDQIMNNRFLKAQFEREDISELPELSIK